jgi:hypothetical protein
VVLSSAVALTTRVRGLFWPVIADEESASRAVRIVSWCIFGWSGLLVCIGVIDLIVVILAPSRTPAGSVASAFVWYTVGLAAVFGLIAWRIRSMSLPWSIVGLVICVIGAISVLPSPFALAVYAFLALISIGAVRATHKYRRLILQNR